MVSAEFDLNSFNNSISTTVIENNEEYNNLMDGNLKIDENITNKNNKNSTKVHFSNANLFELMKDEDVNYNILDDYKEDDDSDSDY